MSYLRTVRRISWETNFAFFVIVALTALVGEWWGVAIQCVTWLMMVLAVHRLHRRHAELRKDLEALQDKLNKMEGRNGR